MEVNKSIIRKLIIRKKEQKEEDTINDKKPTKFNTNTYSKKRIQKTNSFSKKENNSTEDYEEISKKYEQVLQLLKQKENEINKLINQKNRMIKQNKTNKEGFKNLEIIKKEKFSLTGNSSLGASPSKEKNYRLMYYNLLEEVENLKKKYKIKDKCTDIAVDEESVDNFESFKDKKVKFLYFLDDNEIERGLSKIGLDFNRRTYSPFPKNNSKNHFNHSPSPDKLNQMLKTLSHTSIKSPSKNSDTNASRNLNAYQPYKTDNLFKCVLKAKKVYLTPSKKKINVRNLNIKTNNDI